MAAAVEAGLFCTLRAKRCRRVQSPSLSVTAALAAGPLSMVAPASLMAWWQMAERLERLAKVMAGQVALRMQVDLDRPPGVRVEAAVALEDQERHQI